MNDLVFDRMQALRAEMHRLGLAGFVVPHEDAYLNEYIGATDARLEWLTGFSGSAGIAVVLADHAAVLSDARYTAQIRRECPGTLFEVHDLVDVAWRDYAVRNARGGIIGFDPQLHSVDAVTLLRAAAAAHGCRVVPVAANLVDAIWTERPARIPQPAMPHPIEVAGEAASAKCRRIGAQIGAEAMLVATCDNTAWLLNIRGADVPNQPLPLARAVLFADGHVELFIDPASVSRELVTHLGPTVAVHPPGALGERLDALAGQSILVDPTVTPDWIETRLLEAGARVVHGAGPLALAQAVKNPVEISGFRAAHRRDGAAFTALLYWIEQANQAGTIEALDELAVVARLEAIRQAQNTYRGQSFQTISATGANAALPHYRPTEATNTGILTDTVLLVDAGAHYNDGTTDMTRTVAIGQPQPEHVRSYTLVVKAHIAHARLRFPAGIGAMHIDAVARQHLWEAGWDYGHGTAHLVGSLLKVHEGPLYMHWRRGNTVPILPGMLLADEPGHYREGRYGVRFENILLVHEPTMPEGGDVAMASFEAISLAPIDRRLLDPSLLGWQDIAWIDAYHATVLHELSGLVAPEVASWLANETRPL